MTNSLELAPAHIQLAVDLILLLEQNEIVPDIVLAALEIVKQDFINKQNLGGNPSSHIPAHTS